ncbi:N-acetylmuramoyl-L-alanine amidase [Pseudomonas sp. 57B-090624]|nr:N-acetylmuramoyl-L-alanine amidase [Pseudomonas sp. 57B-090624]
MHLKGSDSWKLEAGSWKLEAGSWKKERWGLGAGCHL